MKRFDKVDDTYIGFEDMCVLMGKQRDDKYESSYEQIAKTIKTFVSKKHKKTSLLSYFKIVFINYMIKNGDAHLKNFGLIYNGINDIKLAPAYDIVCTIAYIKHDIPALFMFGSKRWWDKNHLIRFGIEVCELTKKETINALKECENSMMNAKIEIEERLKYEPNEDKKKILEALKEVISSVREC